MKKASVMRRNGFIEGDHETALSGNVELRRTESQTTTVTNATGAQAPVIRQRNKIKITFDPNWDIIADSRGVYQVPSGCTPHNPDETRLIVRNAEYSHRLHPDDHQTVVETADKGSEQQLAVVLNRLYFRVGRAAEGTGWQ